MYRAIDWVPWTYDSFFCERVSSTPLAEPRRDAFPIRCRIFTWEKSGEDGTRIMRSGIWSKSRKPWRV
jgi:hypothetical protein